MSTLTATPISESAVITAYNRDTASNADINTFTSAFKSVTDAIIIDLATLNTDKVDPDDDITFTGDNIFSGTNTFSAATTFTGNITFAGNLVSSGTSKTIDFNTNRAQNIGAATTSTDAIQYQQAVKATGSVTEDITGIKTFTTALPICSVVPSFGSDLVNKTYVDLQVFGNAGITQATSAPATTAGALWLNTTSTSNYELFRANGSVFAPVTGIFQGTSAPTTPSAATGRLWLDTTNSTYPSFKYYDGSAWRQIQPSTFIPSVTLSGGFTVGASQTIDLGGNKATNSATPVSSSDLATKGYVDTASPKIFTSTADVTQTTTSGLSLIGSGVGSLTISANTLIAGSVIRVKAKGYLDVNAGGDDAAMRVAFGGSTQLALTGFNGITASSNVAWSYEAEMTVRTAGVSGTLMTQASFKCGQTGTANGVVLDGVNTTTSTIDTTVNRDVDFNFDWVTIVNSPSITCTNCTVELYK